MSSGYGSALLSLVVALVACVPCKERKKHRQYLKESKAWQQEEKKKPNPDYFDRSRLTTVNRVSVEDLVLGYGTEKKTSTWQSVKTFFKTLFRAEPPPPKWPAPTANMARGKDCARNTKQQANPTPRYVEIPRPRPARKPARKTPPAEVMRIASPDLMEQLYAIDEDAANWLTNPVCLEMMRLPKPSLLKGRERMSEFRSTI